MSQTPRRQAFEVNDPYLCLRVHRCRFRTAHHDDPILCSGRRWRKAELAVHDQRQQPADDAAKLGLYASRRCTASRNTATAASASSGPSTCTARDAPASTSAQRIGRWSPPKSSFITSFEAA